jgi:hypothetical protein
MCLVLGERSTQAEPLKNQHRVSSLLAYSHFLKKDPANDGFRYIRMGNSIQMSLEKNYARKRTEKREEMKKNSELRGNHPRGTISSILQSRTTCLPHGAMAAMLSEAAASAYNNRPGPPPWHPLTSPAKPRCTKPRLPQNTKDFKAVSSRR